MDTPSTSQQWGFAAILGCGLCCGGLLVNAAWLGATAVTLGGLLSGWLWMALAGAFLVVGALLWRRRQRRSCALPEPSG